MCDIDNPMYGPTGAAYVFGPQKGADPAMVEFLDYRLQVLDQTIQRELGVSVAEVPVPAPPALSARASLPF